jgi:hypothetical protein
VFSFHPHAHAISESLIQLPPHHAVNFCQSADRLLLLLLLPLPFVVVSDIVLGMLSWDEHVAKLGRDKESTQNPYLKLSLGRPRTRWENNININLVGIGCENVRWTKLAWDCLQW